MVKFSYEEVANILNKFREIEMPNEKQFSIKDKVISVFENLVLSREEIIDMVISAYPEDTIRSSIIPSDYCYNSINKDPSSFTIHLFETLGNGKYKYLGLNHAYTGDILHNGNVVGSWLNGICTLSKDPRVK